MRVADGPGVDPAWIHDAAADAVLGGERQRTIGLSVMALAVISTIGAAAMAVLLEGLGQQGLLLLAAVPVACVMAFFVVRLGYPVHGAAFAVASAAAGALVAALTAPLLVPAASMFLMLAAILMLGAQVMPFEHAAGLTMVNVVVSIAVPEFMPLASGRAVEIPYLFVFANAILILFAGVLRDRDALRTEAVRAEARMLEERYTRLRNAADAMQSRHDRQLQKAEERARQQRSILDAASHELRTPITPLLLQVAAFQHRYEERLDDDQQHALALLQRNLKRMAVLVGDLLDIARLENNRLDLRLRRSDLRDVLVQTRETFQGQAQENRMHIEVDAEPLWACADSDRVSQVMYNLVSNAIKFGGSDSTIRIRGDVLGDGVQIQVTDEGVGLTAEQERQLFQPFNQVHDPTTGIKGTGLGLYISRGIVNQHDGQIWVRSPGPGQGTTFGFWLPEQGPQGEGEGRVEAPVPAASA